MIKKICRIFFNYLKHIFQNLISLRKILQGGKDSLREYRMSLHRGKGEALPYYSEYDEDVANQPH